MATIFFFIILITTRTVFVTAQEETSELINLINEDTDYNRICGESNVTINFRGLSLPTISKHFLSSSIITCLNLSDNSIESIHSETFAKLPNLRYLDLSYNSFDLNDIFTNTLRNLEILVLNDDRIRYCCPESKNIHFPVSYPKLKKLYLKNWYPRLNLLIENNNLPSLTHLYLSGSSARTNSFYWLPKSLEYLDLSGHELNELTLENLQNLKWLNLDNAVNKLERITLENLINLKYLSLSSNNLYRIDTSTFKNLNSLLHLDLADNHIENIEEDSFNRMENLRYLNLSNNFIDVIKESVFDPLQNLHTLILEKNNITVFSKINNEMKLKVLYLNCNRLKSLNAGMFLNLQQLDTLYLHDNEIIYIDQSSFVGLTNLKTLTLSNNLLSALPFNWMLPLSNINNLDLSDNHFRNFNSLSLSDTSPLENLFLSNQLKYIKASSLDCLPENVTIFLNTEHTFVNSCRKNSEILLRDKYYPRFG